MFRQALYTDTDVLQAGAAPPANMSLKVDDGMERLKQ